MNLMTNKILLTATIDTNNCSYLKRSDIEERKEDYILALESWLTKTSYEIVFVENSNYDLSFLKDKFNNYGDRVEYISYNGNNYNRNLGKGYGEYHSILYALEHSKKLENEVYLNKVTGRYFLEGIEEKLKKLDIEKYDLIGYKREVDHDSIPTVWFIIKKELFINFFSKGIAVNDSNHIYAERVFLDLVKTLTSVYFFNKIGIQGISGTANTKITWME